MWVNSLNHGVEGLDAFNRMLNQLREFHFIYLNSQWINNLIIISNPKEEEEMYSSIMKSTPTGVGVGTDSGTQRGPGGFGGAKSKIS